LGTPDVTVRRAGAARTVVPWWPGLEDTDEFDDTVRRVGAGIRVFCPAFGARAELAATVRRAPCCTGGPTELAETAIRACAASTAPCEDVAAMAVGTDEDTACKRVCPGIGMLEVIVSRAGPVNKAAVP